MKIVIKYLGSMTGRTDTFDPAQEIIAGREEGCAIKYDADRDDLVSRRHVKIVANAACPSGFNIVDLQSRNGTFVNKQRISTPTCLQHLDVVQLGAGGPEFRVEYDPPPAAASRPTRLAVPSELSAARMTREAAIPSAAAAPPPPAAAVRPVGRLTVERMLGESFRKVKLESNKALWIGVAGIVAVVCVGVGLYVYLQRTSQESKMRAMEQQILLQKMDQQTKSEPVLEAQTQTQIAQLEAQLKAAQEENRKQFSQLALSGGSSPQSASASDPQADAQTDAQSEAYDNQLQQALQQFSSNDMAGAMRTCAALIQMDKKRWEAYALAGRALNAANQQAQAKGFFLKAEQLAPAETKPQIQQMIAQMGAPPPA
jgi:hypothetical protein